MNTEHLSEIEIQQYAFDKANAEKQAADHIAVCENCRAKAASYLLLFAEVKQLPQPSFGFDLSQLVLAQIPSAQPKFSWSEFFVYSLTILAILLTAIPVYLFWRNFLILFTTVSTNLLYLVITSVAMILLFQVLDVYKKYQRQIDSLNIS